MITNEKRKELLVTLKAYSNTKNVEKIVIMRFTHSQRQQLYKLMKVTNRTHPAAAIREGIRMLTVKPRSKPPKRGLSYNNRGDRRGSNGRTV